MKKMLTNISLAVALASSMACATEYEFDVTPVIGGVIPEGNLDLDDQLYYGLKVGQKIDGLFDKVEFGIEHAPKVAVDYTGGKEVDILRLNLNLLKNFYVSGGFSTYGLVGVGFEALSDNYRYNNDRPYVDYGLGMRYGFTDRLSLVGEVRHGIKVNANPRDFTQNNLFYSLGFSYAFGEIEQAVVPPKPKPVEVKKVVPVVVEEKVVDRDDDKDGVLNSVDECPNTPAGVPVDAKGCAKTISLHINFNFDKANILPQYDNQINSVANFMTKYPVYKVMLEGYTDSIGSEKYNMKLSDKRSSAVAKALKAKGVSAKRISTVGYGEAKPVSTNMTKEGRAKNRRVDAVFSY
ncbi:MAG: OmpA family protein [Campylobacteraceae bacterium]|nr:OmpA family protein [Campylobacteraceae bacterium]